MTGQTTDLDAILQRLERLERQNRRLRRGWIVVPVLLAAGLLFHSNAQQGRSIQAEEFIVIDSGNKPRAALSWRSDGSVGLGLTDPSGTKVAGLDVTATGITLAMGGDQAKSRAVVEVQANGNATITLADANKKPRCVMALAATNDAFLSLYDGQGTMRQAFLVQASAPDAPATINLFDAAGKQIYLIPRPKEPAAAPKK
jgi:hypothetical protein